MPAPRDLTDQSFGRLTVIGLANSASHNRRWACRCECGTTCIVLGGSLRAGATRSCGCLLREARRVNGQRNIHGHANMNGNGATSTYRSWLGMRSRCDSTSNEHYPDYGGRGITVCARWRSFENFLADMGERPPGMTLDRYPNNDGNYELSNCRWADKYQQARNRRSTKLSVEKATSIRAQACAGASLNEIADAFGFRYELVRRVVHGDTWT